MKTPTLLLGICLVIGQVFGQPANDECNNADPISVFVGSATVVVQDLSNATQSTPDPVCESQSFTDVWYSFTMPVNGNVYINGSSFNNFEILDACSGVSLFCFGSDGYGFSLTGGQNYILRGWRRTSVPGQLNFTIEAFDAISNDECTDAMPISVAVGSATTIIQENRGATQSTPDPVCESQNFTDAWYSFTMPVNGNIYINGSNFNNFEILDACSGVSLFCFGSDGYGFSLTGGQNYILRGWRRTSLPGQLNFTIEAFGAVSNDECTDALPISVNTTCSGATTSVDLRGATGGIFNPSCENQTYTDAWYFFESPIDGNIDVKFSSSFTKYAFYNNCPQTQTDYDNPLACFSGNGTLTGVSFGDTIYMQVLRSQVSPGEGNFCLEGAYAVSDPAPNVCVQATVTIDGTNNNQWVPIRDANGEIIAAIDANGENLGQVDVRLLIDLNDTRVFNLNPYLRREVEVTTAVEPTTSVRLRIYLLADELNDLIAVDPTLNSILGLNTMKSPQTGCSNGYDGSGVFINCVGKDYGPDHYIEFSVNDFSTFYPTSSELVPLPVELVHFSVVRRETNTHFLTWKTASEYNTSHFIVEHSPNADKWEAIGRIDAVGFSQTNEEYQFAYISIEKRSYYRLKIVDFDGQIEYSHIVYLNNLETSGFNLFPNPVSDILYVSSDKRLDKIKIVDISGRVVFVSNSAGHSIDITTLKSGIYFVIVNEQIRRFIKI